MIRRLFFPACLAIALIGAAAAPAAEPRTVYDVVPADSEFVAVLNVRRAMDSELVQGILTSEENREARQARIDLLTAFTGVDITRDLHEVIVAGQVNRDESLVLAARCDFKPDQLLNLLKANGTYKSIDHDGMTVHNWVDKGDTNYCVLFGSQMLVLTHSLDRLDQSLATASSPDTLARKLPAEALQSAFWLSIDRPADADRKLLEACENLQLESIAMRFDLAPGEVVAQAEVFTTSPDAVSNWQDMFRGLLAMVQLNTTDPGAVLVGKNTTVATDEALKRATITTRLPNASLQPMIQEAMRKNL